MRVCIARNKNVLQARGDWKQFSSNHCLIVITLVPFWKPRLFRAGRKERRPQASPACFYRTDVLYCRGLGTPWKRGAPACTLAIHGLEQLMGLFCKSIGPASNGHRSWCLWSRSESCWIESAGRFRDRDKPPSFMRGFMT